MTNPAATLIALDSSLTPADVVKLILDGSDLSIDVFGPSARDFAGRSNARPVAAKNAFSAC